ncbi:hypothetical protein BV25DRAFT_1922221 [Artomyces pyxidatus]|uniref:Uncharacterized protein n=1 Tax=Artomyces pyxidatus TaxID=48021 RepID=A0ACB8SFD6_9AGAM|nr:hypothetical protein BV25DRAFT_1922221 [Artomyces pyxidatus]
MSYHAATSFVISAEPGPLRQRECKPVILTSSEISSDISIPITVAKAQLSSVVAGKKRACRKLKARISISSRVASGLRERISEQRRSLEQIRVANKALDAEALRLQLAIHAVLYHNAIPQLSGSHLETISVCSKPDPVIQTVPTPAIGSSVNSERRILFTRILHSNTCHEKGATFAGGQIVRWGMFARRIRLEGVV